MGPTIQEARLTTLAILAALLTQAPMPGPYQDDGARAVIERARVVRDRELDGIQSYEGLLRERIYAGLEVRAFGRERALYDAERVARVRWERGVGRTVQWLAAREDAPVLGAGGRVSWSKDDGDGEGGHIGIGVVSASPGDAETREETLRRLNPLMFEFRPGDDRLVLGNRFALHPLADSAPQHYRYRSGDTLTLQLPLEDRSITLVEIVVEPKRTDFELIAGSLWFDLESAALVRAHYRPSRPFDLALDEGENVPGILSPFRVRVDYLTIEYALHEGEWWLPWRFALNGEVSAGASLTIPAAVDWRVSNYTLNTQASEIPPDPPPGWISHTDSVEVRRGTLEAVRVLAPPIASLRDSPLLSGESLGESAGAFSDEELDRVREQLDALTPARAPGGAVLHYGWADGNLRYNRVEGLGVGASLEHPLGRRYTVEPRLRFGLADHQVRGSLRLAMQASAEQEVGLTLFRRLAHTDDFGDPHGFGTSLSNFLLRNGHSHFYDAVGVEAETTHCGRRSRFHVRAFREDHSAVRTALGAGRARIVAQLFIEMLVLAILAAGFGLLIADRVVVPAMGWLLERGPAWLDLGVQPTTVLWAFLLAALSAAVVGVVPALKATSPSVQRNLQRAAASRSGVRFGGLSSALLVADVALAVTIVGLAAFLSSQVRRSAGQASAIPAEQILFAELSVPQTAGDGGDDALDRTGFAERLGATQTELLRRLRDEPRVREVSVASSVIGLRTVAHIELDDGPGGGLRRYAMTANVDANFLDALGHPVLVGRDFTRADAGTGGRPVIVNSTFVDEVLGGSNPIGRLLRYVPGPDAEPGPWHEIVGVVGDIGMNQSSPDPQRGLYRVATPGEIYPSQLVIRLDGAPDSFSSRLRAIAAEVDAGIMVNDVRRLDKVVQGNRMVWLSSLGGIGFGLLVLVVLTAAGIYALMSFTVTERTREIGIRRALGAGRGTIARIVATRAIAQIGIGVLLGLPFAAIAFTQSAAIGDLSRPSVISSVLTMGVGAMIVIALIASAGPTLRALRISPNEALRQE